MVDRSIVVRRLAHGLIALAPLYYLLPVDLPVIDVRRWVLLIVFFAAVIGFEAFRLWKGLTFLGLRPHEKNQIASFVWAAAGITAVLWLFPVFIASGVLVGMAIVDPIAGELRRARVPERLLVPVCLIEYFVLCMAAFLVASDRYRPELVAFALVGTIVAILAERTKVAHVDDDFLMLLAPAVAMSALELLL